MIGTCMQCLFFLVETTPCHTTSMVGIEQHSTLIDAFATTVVPASHAEAYTLNMK